MKSLSLNSTTELWLPYPKGVSAYCGQASFSSGTHQDCHAWDFVLPAETPILNVTRGRVFFLIDNSFATGINNFASANMVFIDLGNSRFATYLHHAPHSARVTLGEVVELGTKLAEVGNSGTIIPHIHFDLRGASWNTTHNVRFIGHQEQAIELVQGENYLSGTREFAHNSNEIFEDSVLEGTEFLANGIRLIAGLPARSLPVETEIVFRGSVTKRREHVFFYMWETGKTKPTLTSQTAVDSKGEFALSVTIPEQLTGCYWFKVTAGQRSGKAALPAWIH